MLGQIAQNYVNRSSESVQELVGLIFEKRNNICLNAEKLNNVEVTKLESKVVGGNSALTESGIGTIWQVNTSGRIFFLEDTNEEPYRIESTLAHMNQSGIFDGVVAVVFGDFTETDDVKMNVVLRRFAESAPFPVFRVSGIGHTEGVNHPLPLLTHAEISVNGTDYTFCVDNIQNTGNKTDDGQGDENENDKGSCNNIYPLFAVVAISFIFLCFQ